MNRLFDTAFYDPAESAIVPPYTSVFSNYVRSELNYNPMVLVDKVEEGWEWGWAFRAFK